MRGHRRTAALTWAVVAVAATAGALALVLPWLRRGPEPTAGDVAAGWALLAASCVVIGRRLAVGTITLVAGVVWIAVGAATLFEGPLSTGVARLALAPTAGLVIALTLVAPRQRPARQHRVVVLATLAIAAVGAIGAHRFAMAAFGACLLLPLADVRATGRRATNRLPPLAGAPAPTAWVGAGLLAVGLGSGLDLADLSFVTNLHQLVIVIGAATVAWQTLEAPPGAGDPVLGALTAALSDVLGYELAAIAFPSSGPASNAVDGDATWLDPAGAVCELADGGGLVSSEDGVPVAWLVPPLERGAHVPDLLRLLAVTGDVARLRAQLYARANEIELSTHRLETAADSERARLAAMLESGPIATLGQVAELFESGAVSADLHQRLGAAKRTLREVVDGIEPIDPGDGLTVALQHLAARFGASWDIDGPVDDLRPGVERLVWFTCAEGLANATKHAGGAPLALTLSCREGGFALQVVDHGAGGADASGHGLALLARRAAESGAVLVVDSPPGIGTRLTLTGSADTCHPPVRPASTPMFTVAPEEMIVL